MIGESDGGRHFACTMPSVMLRMLRNEGGAEAVTDVLERAGSMRSPEYLEDVTNWISWDEALALFDAAEDHTGDPGIARRIGEQTVAQHAGTPVATLLRSLGSPEEVLSKITVTASKFSTVADMEAVEVTPGRAVVRAREREGFSRARHHCNWTLGLLSQVTMLFGLPPATVEQSECVLRGDSHCVYAVTGDRFVRRILQRFAALSLIAVPIVAHGHLLGLLTVAVHSRRERLDPRQDLLDRLSGVAAHAASALENGRLIDRVTHQARHDGLTGLANRAFFAERIEGALSRARSTEAPLGLFFVDLDGFKAVNDERGHAVGDELLRQVASRLLDTVHLGHGRPPRRRRVRDRALGRREHG